MLNKLFILLFSITLLYSCSKNEKAISIPDPKEKSIEVYKEALNALEGGDIFFASKKFSEAELIMPTIEQSAKAALMNGFCLYTIRFYDQAIESLTRYKKKYPSDKNIIYAEYLINLSHYEQVLDEKKDIAPLIISKKKIKKFIKKYPKTDYSLDLRFKLDLINNQLAAKELYVAKFYIQTKKWIPAINRLKNIVENYSETIFVEEALHRLVEVYYTVGLTEEAKKSAAILGYNYNSSEWYEQTYKIFNKKYKVKKPEKDKDDGILKKTLKRILN